MNETIDIEAIPEIVLDEEDIKVLALNSRQLDSDPPF